MRDAMNALQWTAARGDRWRDRLGGMEATLAPVDGPLLDALGLDAPARVADLGCGGGGTTLEIARRAPPGSVVRGFDISSALIEEGRRRQGSGERDVLFEVADVATAAPDAPYDRLASRFGVMFFDDPPAAFANLRRWLAPGGRFAFAVWGPSSDNPWMTTVRDAVARVIAVPPGDPAAPGPFRYADVDALLALLAAAGFTGLAARDWRGELPVGGALSPAEAARFALTSFASFDDLLGRAGDEARAAAEASLTASFSRHHRDGAVRLGARVRVVTGAHP